MSKIFVILALLCAFSSVIAVVKAFDERELVLEIMADAEACKEEVGASESDYIKSINRQPSVTMEGKCLRSCMMKKSGVMDSNGKFVKEAAIAEAEKLTNGAKDKIKIAHEINDACSGIEVSDDHCEAAEEYEKCIIDYMIAHNNED